MPVARVMNIHTHALQLQIPILLSSVQELGVRFVILYNFVEFLEYADCQWLA
jgi:hypothetical protein